MSWSYFGSWFEEQAWQRYYDECNALPILKVYLSLKPETKEFLRGKFLSDVPSYLEKKERRDEYIRDLWVEHKMEDWYQSSFAS